MATRKKSANTQQSSLPLPEPRQDYDPDVPSRENILNLLRGADKPLALQQLINHFNLTRQAGVDGLEKRLTAMQRDGQLDNTAQGWQVTTKPKDYVIGRVQGHRDGFGFLIPEDGGQDLFLSAREMLKVLHGDRVQVKPTGEYRGKPEGTIVEVLERSTNRLVGRLLQEQGIYVVAPEDQRIKHDILVPAS